MPTQTKRAKTGFVGEFFIYSELIKRGKNCFITLGNAKSVDLILVDREKRAFFIDVKSSNTLMKNYHKHADYSEEMGLLARWQVSVKIFWECHPKNGHFEKRDLPDFYIFHSLQKRELSYI